MAWSFEGIEEALRMAYPARAMAGNSLTVGRMILARKVGEDVAEQTHKWTVQVNLVNEDTILKGSFKDLATAWAYADAYRKQGYVQARITEADVDNSYIMYPITSVLSMHCRIVNDFEETQAP